MRLINRYGCILEYRYGCILKYRCTVRLEEYDYSTAIETLWYGRTVVQKPRTCVFGGTTNSKDYLPDSTGNRRFWPVHCEAIDRDGLRQDRDQLWAEAIVRYRNGESFLLSDAARTEALKEQEERFQEDAWEESIVAYLKYHDGVTTAEILENVLEYPNKGCWKRSDEMRVGKILARQGLKKGVETSNGKRRSVYRKQL